MESNKLGSWVASEIISMLNRERSYQEESIDDALSAIRSGDYQGLEPEDIRSIASTSAKRIEEIDQAIKVIQAISE